MTSTFVDEYFRDLVRPIWENCRTNFGTLGNTYIIKADADGNWINGWIEVKIESPNVVALDCVANFMKELEKTFKTTLRFKYLHNTFIIKGKFNIPEDRRDLTKEIIWNNRFKIFATPRSLLVSKNPEDNELLEIKVLSIVVDLDEKITLEFSLPETVYLQKLSNNSTKIKDSQKLKVPVIDGSARLRFLIGHEGHRLCDDNLAVTVLETGASVSVSIRTVL